MAAQSATPLLKVEGLKQYFKVNKNFTVKAVDDVSFEIYPGETYGLVGESGSGKSTIGRSIIRLYDPTAGRITFDGQDISGHLSHAQNNTLRTQMQMIFQDPMASLNPRKKVEDIIGEGLDIHHMYKTQAERREKVEKILAKVGLAPEHAERYPHQFSGGQRQRVGIARALIMNPKLIIADECISALDVSIQAQVVNLMKDIQQETGTAYLFIAHDLSMVKYISDRIGVLHLGHLLETGTTEEIFAQALGVPESVIALTFVALGTSLPELVTAITSLMKGHSDLSLGNVVGANVFNLVLVSGVSVALAPFDIPQSATLFGINSSLVLELPVMLLVMILLTIPALVRGRLSRVQGVALLCIYAAFCAVQFTL